MGIVRITGTSSYMDAELDDGRTVRIQGELLVDGFVGYMNSIQEWTTPRGVRITPSEKQLIIHGILDHAKGPGQKLRITLE